MKKIKYILIVLAITGLCSCTPRPDTLQQAKPEESYAEIYPFYADSLVLPCNIAPLNFMIKGTDFPCAARLEALNKEGIKVYSGAVKIHKKHGGFSLPLWKKLMQSAAGGELRITPYEKKKGGWVRYKTLHWQISADSIDAYLVYRSGPHDQNIGGRLQVWQRNLENYNQSVLMDNAYTGNNCMNCHTVSANNAQRMVFHIRQAHAGTVVVTPDTVLKLTVPPRYGFRLSYPDWAANGRYIAFATTRIYPLRYVNNSRTQDLMLDAGGRITVYDVKQNRLFSHPALCDSAYSYSFPAWGPGGTVLYFCRTAQINPATLKDTCEKRRISGFLYDIYALDFDTSACVFADSAHLIYSFKNRAFSASIPALSPNGQYLFVSLMLMGSFPSQDQGSLALINLQDTARQDPMAACASISSRDCDRRAVFSSNGRWIIFGSKRESGANPVFYISHFGPEGQLSTPFVVPQRRCDYYLNNTRSFIFPVLSRTPSALNLKKYREAVLKEAVEPDLSYFTPVSGDNITEIQAGH